MTPYVFADTGYWIAMFNPNDELHKKARAVTEQLGTLHIVTTEMVLVEFLNFVGGEGSHVRQLAATVVRNLSSHPTVEVCAQTSNQFRASVERYSDRLDQNWSVTDCASFLLMEERGIQQALAFDRNFEQAGFTALLR